MIGIIRPEDPVTKWNSNGIDTRLSQPGKVFAGNEGVPMLSQRLRRFFAQFNAVGRFISRLQALKQTRRHPFLKHQPSAQINAAQFLIGLFANRLIHRCFPAVNT